MLCGVPALITAMRFYAPRRSPLLRFSSWTGDEQPPDSRPRICAGCTARGGAVFSPYLFNGPKLVFLSGPEVLPGQRLRLFGRNLQPGDGTTAPSTTTR